MTRRQIKLVALPWVLGLLALICGARILLQWAMKKEFPMTYNPASLDGCGWLVENLFIPTFLILLWIGLTGLLASLWTKWKELEP